MILLRHGETVFNVIFGATRRDPGVRDPRLTERGRAQADEAARALARETITRVVASPYTRAIQTGDVIARALGVPMVIDEAVRERFCYSCDVGTPSSVLAARWSTYVFDHLDDVWWPESEEPVDHLHARSTAFRRRMVEADEWRTTAVVTHWGVIRALTGKRIKNGEMLRLDPTKAILETGRGSE